MAARLVFERASAATEHQLRRLLRDNPLSGRIRVSLEREPDAFHAAGISGDSFQLMLARDGDSGAILGSGSRFELPMYVNGRVHRVGYFGELRAEGGLRQRRQLLFGSYRKMREFHDAGDVDFYLTTIVADNTPARRLLEAGLGDMPTYRPLESMITFTIPAAHGARRARGGAGAWTKPASDAQLADIAFALGRQGPDYNFHPEWTRENLRSGERCRGLASSDFFVSRRGGEFRACLALWDQRQFKQTVIRGYSPSLGKLRPLINLAAPLLSRPRLPAPGTRLESAFLSHVVADPDDAEALVNLVARACREAVRRKIDYVMLAFAERNPLAAELRRQFSCHEYISVIYIVHWEDGAAAAAEIDDRMPHPEVAIL